MPHTITSTTVTITADNLCRALYDEGVECVNRGTYQDTNIPLRPIPGDAMLTITDRGIIVVEDSDGGWIADRIGPTLGRREYRRVRTATEALTNSGE